MFALVRRCITFIVSVKDMQRAQPISLNRLSYDSVIKALECIRNIRPEAPIVDHVYVDTGENLMVRLRD